MSNKINDGGPAFPVPSVGTGDPRDGMTRGSDGMSVRTWLAGQALPSILSYALNYETHCDAPKNPWTQEAVIALAVSYADKMIAALEKS
jgi:hypothetical protein